MLASLTSLPLAAFPVIEAGRPSHQDVSRPARRSRRTARVFAEPPLRRPSVASADVVASIVRPDCYRRERQLPGGTRTR